MIPRIVATIRIAPEDEHIEIALEPGFTRAELDVVRTLPHRRYDAGRRIWVAPNARLAIATLTEAFGASSVSMSAEPDRARLISWNSSSRRESQEATRTR